MVNDKEKDAETEDYWKDKEETNKEVEELKVLHREVAG